jgi:tetrapyrrole methylase family protein/MazG family protein
MSAITLLGLGPGDPSRITREAWEVLENSQDIMLRTRQHPAVLHLPAALGIRSFDDLYETGESFEQVYAWIVDQILEAGKREEGVVYGVPGDPFVAEATCPAIAARARQEGIPLRIVSGVSFLEPTFAALGLDPYPRLTLIDALQLGDSHVPAFPPDSPALIAQIYSRMVASEVKLTLNAIYPDEHRVKLVHAAGTPQEHVEDLPLFEIDRSKYIGLLSSLYVPPLREGTSFESFQEIIAHLRAPDGCPWDREQTHLSLRGHLLEETYELLSAMDQEDEAKMAEEFGDLLLQIVLNAQIANEAGEFNVNEVIQGIYDKIIRRHPHVFGDIKVKGVEGVLANWEKLKAEEREANGEEKASLLDSLPLALPALTLAEEYQDRAARVGFDWPEIGGVLDKIAEEVQEIRDVTDEQELAAELGDLFFALVNLARWKKVDAESALRGCNLRFKQRFSYIEQKAREQGKKISDLRLEEMEVLWQEAKHQSGA